MGLLFLVIFNTIITFQVLAAALAITGLFFLVSKDKVEISIGAALMAASAATLVIGALLFQEYAQSIVAGLYLVYSVYRYKISSK